MRPERRDFPTNTADGRAALRERVRASLQIGPDGSIFVAEFVTGGRLVRLAPAAGA